MAKYWYSYCAPGPQTTSSTLLTSNHCNAHTCIDGCKICIIRAIGTRSSNSPSSLSPRIIT